jgi:ABC-type histidine transport system ATPase subunit
MLKEFSPHISETGKESLVAADEDWARCCSTPLFAGNGSREEKGEGQATLDSPLSRSLQRFVQLWALIASFVVFLLAFSFEIAV